VEAIVRAEGSLEEEEGEIGEGTKALEYFGQGAELEP
jgi:hypothetical protein